PEHHRGLLPALRRRLHHLARHHGELGLEPDGVGGHARPHPHRRARVLPRLLPEQGAQVAGWGAPAGHPDRRHRRRRPRGRALRSLELVAAHARRRDRPRLPGARGRVLDRVDRRSARDRRDRGLDVRVLPQLLRPMTVLVARAGDEDAIFALVGQLGQALPAERAAFDRAICSYLEGAQLTVLLHVVEDDGAIRGYALTTIVPLRSTNGLSAQLQELVVGAEARGKDYGTQLVKAVEAECERRGVRQLTVASRRAGGFYDRLGFHESAEYMRRFF